MTGLIILAAFALAIAGLVAWFLIRNRKENERPSAPQQGGPSEADVHETYGPQPPAEEETATDTVVGHVHQDHDKPLEPEPQEPREPETQEEPAGDDDDADGWDRFTAVLTDFETLLVKDLNGRTGDYLSRLYFEAYCQYHDGRSDNGLPLLSSELNFPVVKPADPLYGDKDSAFRTLVGWLFALQLSEVMPDARQRLMAYGYGYGGYDAGSRLFGYAPMYDPMNMRILAGSIYAAMRGQVKPDIRAMREELGTSALGDDLQTVLDSDACDFARFYVDLRNFLPSAPGPYAPGWEDRPDAIPGDDKEEHRNLAHDREVHEYIVQNYNLDDQRAVQATADKEADMHHLFGVPRTAGGYGLMPSFGRHNIGVTLDPDSCTAELTNLCMYISSYAREILQSRDAGLYGRLRPGCSWGSEAVPNSYDDLRRDVLTKFEIEDNDGHPTGYYDKDGHWTQPSEVGSADDYEWMQRRSLWANSYPSGHSAGIMGAAMVLMELMPERSDRILKAANQFAVNRTIARYHWTSDTLIGRVVGTVGGALCRATTDFDDRLARAAEELRGG